MWWWNKNSLLEKQLQTLQNDFAQEQGKATRLAGFLGRLQSFGNSPDGKFSERAFAEAVVDALHGLLHTEQVLFLSIDPETLTFTPLAARGLAPQVLNTIDIQQLEDVKKFLSSPVLVQNLMSQGHSLGMLAVARAQGADFTAEEKTFLSLVANQTAVLLVQNSLVRKIAAARNQTVDALTRAIGAKDSYTFTHAKRTRTLVRAFAQDLSLPDVLVEQMEAGALLHDVGKIGIDDSILKKPGELTSEETRLMRTHSRLGYEILEPVKLLHTVSAIVLYHQEWYNGTGYPEGLAGEEIPLGARIVQIIDAWGAMTSERPYRKAMSKAQAVAELRKQAGSQFDPKLVEVFLRVLNRLEHEGIELTDAPVTPPVASRKA